MKKIKNYRSGTVLVTATLLSLLFHSCFKDLPANTIVYQNDFENKEPTGIKVFNNNGPVDTPTITSFNGNHIFGRFNDNLIYLKINNLPPHNLLRIEFDLYIHDKWDGDYIAPGSNSPDAWGMNLDNNTFYFTTFSNGTYRQSFPANYTVVGGFPNPPKADAWDPNLPGACSLQNSRNGTSMYKMLKTTGHTNDSLEIFMNAALNPSGDYCLKSWSIDNLKITAIKYNN